MDTEWTISISLTLFGLTLQAQTSEATLSCQTNSALHAITYLFVCDHFPPRWFNVINRVSGSDSIKETDAYVL